MCVCGMHFPLQQKKKVPTPRALCFLGSGIDSLVEWHIDDGSRGAVRNPFTSSPVSFAPTPL